MPRAIKGLDISLGLATIPVQLFTATGSQGVAFHLLHERCGSRIQMRLEKSLERKALAKAPPKSEQEAASAARLVASRRARVA